MKSTPGVSQRCLLRCFKGSQQSLISCLISCHSHETMRTGHRSPSPVPLTLYTSLTESGRNSGAHMSQYCKGPFSCLTTYCSHIILCNTQNMSSFFNTIYGHVFHTTLCLLVLEREDLSNGFKGIKWGNSFSFLSHQTISLIGRLISSYVCRLKMWTYNIHSFYISR